MRKVCFADICGVQLPTRKLLKILSLKTERDIGELLKSMTGEFLVHVSQEGDYVEGLHPVRSQHIVDRLHEYYPLVEIALDITRIANIQDFPILFAHYPEFKFDKEEFYSNFVDEWWDVKDLKCFLFSVRGTFSGSVMQYFLNNRGAFNEANARGGLFVFATELLMYTSFCGNRERYLGFVESNLPMILTYLKHKTKSHRLYVSNNERA